MRNETRPESERDGDSTYDEGNDEESKQAGPTVFVDVSRLVGKLRGRYFGSHFVILQGVL